MRAHLFALATALTLGATHASAFCGFYVARADGELYNQASKVIFTRVNETSVITMSSDYQGPVAEFAMIVPTPYVLERAQVKTVQTKTVDHLDNYTAPRLVEYFDGDPCALPIPEMVMSAAVPDRGAPTEQQRRDGARALGVTIEREYAVGSYDIQMLGASQSDGLAAFLRGEGYKLPDGAETALDGYVRMGMKFFVARVNLSRHETAAVQELEPLQISFRSKDFMLPLQLGKLNGNGPQDLIVLALTRTGRVDLKGHTLQRIPTDENIPLLVKDRFAQFYRAMFDKIAPNSGAFLEYAWDMAWCDPCADDPLTLDEFRQLGVRWVRKSNVSTPDVFVTRMHIRYDKTSFVQDLNFTETGDRENFQGRYVMTHPFEGEITCDEGKTYVAETRKRLKSEAETLRKLTGWKKADIAALLAKTTPARYR